MGRVEKYWLKQDREKQRFERYYFKQIQTILRDQIKPLVNNFNYLQSPQDVIDKGQNLITRAPISRIYLDIYKRVGAYFIKEQLKQIKGVDIDWTVKQELNPDPVDMEALWFSQIQDYVIAEAGDRIISVVDSQRKRVADIVKQITDSALDEGLTMREVMAKIEAEIPRAWRNQTFWAERIARTEVLGAANEGNMRAAKATGLELNKVWITRLDGRERDSHRALNGQKVPINQPFKFGALEMNKPGDFRAGAAEVINCRCAVGFERRLNT